MPSGFNIEANVTLNSASLNASAKEVKQALGRITGQASEFQKSLDASTARVFAFGATTAVLNGVTQSFKKLVSVTVEVEKRLVEINSIFQATDAVFNKFRNSIFQVAKETGQAFSTVADGAAELARQGLSAEETANRLKAALVLTRISGLDAEKSVKALTAAINGFASAGLTANQIVNKMVAVDTAFAVSAQDLAEAFSRAGSTAEDAGVSFDQLLGLVTAVEQRTARGGAVIGNAFKSIFTRLSRGNTIDQLKDLGVQIDATQTGIQKLQALSKALDNITDPTVASQIKELAGGVFQINVVSAALKDLGSDTSIFAGAAKTASEAMNEAFEKNATLNKTIAAQINTLVVGLTSLAEKIGSITFGPLLENLIGLATKFTEFLDKALDPEKGNVFIKGLFKTIGQFLAGPALVIFTAAFVKIFGLVAKFAKDGLKSIFLIGSETQKIQGIEAGLITLLQKDDNLRKTIASTTATQAQKEQAVIQAIQRENALLTQQAQIMRQLATMAASRGVTGVTAQGGFRGRRGRMFPHGFKQEEAMAKMLGAKNPRGKMVNARINGKQQNVIANTEEIIARGVGRNGDDAIIPTYAGGYVPNFAARFALNAFGKFGKASGGKTVAELKNEINPATGKTYTRSDLEKLGIRSSSLTPVFGKKRAGASKKKGHLSLDGSDFGVLAAFAGDGSRNPFTTLFSRRTREAFPSFSDITAGEKIKKVQLKGVQVANLNTFNKGFEKKFKGGITQFFTEPLQQFGTHMTDSVFRNDEARKIAAEIKKNKKTRLFSKSVEGGIFESAMSMLLKGERAIKDFASNRDDSASWDFEENGGLSERFQDFARFKPAVFRADAKRTSGPEAMRSIIAKVLQNPSSRSLAKTKAKFFAGGFIPNVGPMNDAIKRERDAGVPLNKIRAHFAGGSLGGSAIAITNTEHEKRGLKSVPNFAKGGKGRGGSDGMAEDVGFMRGTFRFLLLQQGINMLVSSKQKEIAATQAKVNEDLEAAQKQKEAAETIGEATDAIDKTIKSLESRNKQLEKDFANVGQDIGGTGMNLDAVMTTMMAMQLLPMGKIFSKGKQMGSSMMKRMGVKPPVPQKTVTPFGADAPRRNMREIRARHASTRPSGGPRSMVTGRSPVMPRGPIPRTTPRGFMPKGALGKGGVATLALLTAQAVGDLFKSNEGEKGRDEMFFFNLLGGKEGFNDLFGLSDTKRGEVSATGKVRIPFFGQNFNDFRRENMVPNAVRSAGDRNIVEFMSRMTGQIPKLSPEPLRVGDRNMVFGRDITAPSGSGFRQKLSTGEFGFTSPDDVGHLGKGAADLRLGMEEQRGAIARAAKMAFKERLDRARSAAVADEDQPRIDVLDDALAAFKTWTKNTNLSAEASAHFFQVMTQGLMAGEQRLALDDEIQAMIQKELANRDQIIESGKALASSFEASARVAKSASEAASNNLGDFEILKALKAPSGPNRDRTLNMIDLEHQQALTTDLEAKAALDRSKLQQRMFERSPLFGGSIFGGEDGINNTLAEDAPETSELVKNLQKSGGKFLEQVTKASIFFRNKIVDITERQKQAAEQQTKLMTEMLSKQTTILQDTFTKGEIDFAAIDSDSGLLAELIRRFEDPAIQGQDRENTIDQIGRLINELTSSESFKRADAQTEGNLLQDVLKQLGITADALAAAQEAAIMQGTGASGIRAGDDGSISAGIVSTGRNKALNQPLDENRQEQQQLADQLADTKKKIEEFGKRFGEDDPEAKRIIDNVTNLGVALEDAVKFVRKFGGGEGDEGGEGPNLFAQMAEMNESVASMVADAAEASAASAAAITALKRRLGASEAMIEDLRAEDERIQANFGKNK